MVLPYMGVKMGFTGDLIQFISLAYCVAQELGWPIAVCVEVAISSFITLCSVGPFLNLT